MQTTLAQLAAPAQEQLSALTKPGATVPPYVRVISLSGVGGKIFGIVFGMLMVLGAVVLGCADDRWRDAQGYVVAIGAWLGLMLVIYQGAAARRMRRSRTRPAFVATPIIAAYVETDDKPIHIHYLKDLKDFKGTHHYHNGAYMRTQFHFDFAAGTLDVPVGSKPAAEDLLEYLRKSPAFIQQWIAEGTAEQKIRELDWIGGAALEATPVAPRPLWDRGWPKFGASVAGALLITAFSWGASQVYWDYEMWSHCCRADDYRRYVEHAPVGFWKKAAARKYDDQLYAECRGNAASLRQYLQALPNGTHVTEARTRLREIYAEAGQAYVKKAGQADPAAADGMKALLAFLAEQMSPRVTICFAPSEGTDGAAAVADAKTKTGSTKIHGWGGCFTAAKNREREDDIVKAMKSSFRTVLSNDLFDLQAGERTDDGPRFLVRYRVLGSGTVYTIRDQAGLPAAERDVYPGIQLAFDFSLQVPGSAKPPDPDPANGFRFQTTAKPAPTFMADTTDDDNVYGTMVGTAFETFKFELVAAYGLRGEETEK